MIFKALIINLIINSFFSFTLVGPLFNSIGGFIACYFLQKKAPQAVKGEFISLFFSLVNALVCSYLFLICLYFSLKFNSEVSWLNFEGLQETFYNSYNFKLILFLSIGFISFIMNFIGCKISFYLGVGKKIESEEKLMSKLNIEELNIYLEESST